MRVVALDARSPAVVSPAGGHSSVHHQASMAPISPSLIVGMPVSVDIMG
jgi:hypothetical protein